MPYYPSPAPITRDVVNSRIGINETAPQRALHLKAATTQLRIEDADGGYLDWNTNNNGSGGILNDIDLIPVDSLQSAIFRFFRNTNITGVVAFDIARGNNSSQTNVRLGGNTSSIINGVTGSCSIGHANAATAAADLAASTTARAPLRLRHGVEPTTGLNDGDVWTTTAGLFVRINGTTYSVNLTAV